MNIIDKLKSLGVEVTEEIEKAFPGEFVDQYSGTGQRNSY